MEEKIQTVLNHIECEAVIPQYIIVLYFGLYETEKGYCIYLVGSKEYNEKDDVWAEETENLPCDFFLEIESMDDWRTFQNQIECIIREEVSRRRKSVSSPFYDKIITIGFDDGSITKIS